MHLLSLLAQAPYYNDNYYYSGPNDYGDAGLGVAMILTILVFTLIAAAAAYVITSYFLSRIFKKAGLDAWKAWVPVYNNWVLLELGGQAGWWAILAFVPVVNIVAAIFMYIAMYHVGLNFGKDGAFVLLAIFIPIVWLIWLAVDKSTWKGAPVQASASQPDGAPAYQPPVERPDNNQTPSVK